MTSLGEHTLTVGFSVTTMALNTQRLNTQRLSTQPLNTPRLSNQRMNTQWLGNERMNTQRLSNQRINNPRFNTQQLNAQRLNIRLLAGAVFLLLACVTGKGKPLSQTPSSGYWPRSKRRTLDHQNQSYD